MIRYREKLEQRIRECGSRLCVGLDPRPEQIPTDPRQFLVEVVEQTADHAAAFKPNAAYFEAMGLEGARLLEYVLERIPPQIPVIFDGKRGDIGETQNFYARACVEVWGADAVTVNPYLGRETLAPFLEYQDRGVYVLALTSNPGARDLQLRRVEGRYLFEWVQDWTEESDQVGVVVGLTNVTDEVRPLLKDVPMLVPGLGAQGGDLAGLGDGGRKAPLLVNVSRGILFQEPELSFGEKANRYAEQIEIALAKNSGKECQ